MLSRMHACMDDPRESTSVRRHAGRTSRFMTRRYDVIPGHDAAKEVCLRCRRRRQDNLRQPRRDVMDAGDGEPVLAAAVDRDLNVAHAHAATATNAMNSHRLAAEASLSLLLERAVGVNEGDGTLSVHPCHALFMAGRQRGH